MNMNRKQFFPVLLMLLSASGFCGNAAPNERFSPKPVIPRRIEIKAEQTLPIAKGGKALCEVIVPAKSSPMLQYAGSRLAFYLGKMIGSKVAVKTKSSGQCPAFILGPAGAKLANFDLTKLDQDGYIIKTIGNRIVIAGNDDPKANPEQKSGPVWKERGTLYGVYEFLERFGGVRFYFPGDIGTVVPRKPDWKLPQIDIVDRPDMQFRRLSFGKRALGKKNQFLQRNSGKGNPNRNLFSDADEYKVHTELPWPCFSGTGPAFQQNPSGIFCFER